MHFVLESILGIGVGGSLYLKTEQPSHGQLKIDILEMPPPNKRVSLLLQYENYPSAGRPPTSPSSMLIGQLYWEANIDFYETGVFDKTGSNIKSLAVNGISIIDSKAMRLFTLRPFEIPEESFPNSLLVCTELIEQGFEAVDLALKGDDSPIHGYHIGASDLHDHEELRNAVYDRLLIAHQKIDNLKTIGDLMLTLRADTLRQISSPQPMEIIYIKPDLFITTLAEVV